MSQKRKKFELPQPPASDDEEASTDEDTPILQKKKKKGPKEYKTLWRGQDVCESCEDIEEMVEKLRQNADTLEKLAKRGLRLRSSVDCGEAWLVTPDEQLREDAYDQLDLQEYEEAKDL